MVDVAIILSRQCNPSLSQGGSAFGAGAGAAAEVLLLLLLLLVVVTPG
jgi:hypothetical protein